MATVGLVSCVKKKRASSAAARDLYQSALFQKLRAFAESKCDAWYILSAEHGLLQPDRVIAPYDTTLNAMPKRQRLEWAIRVQDQLLHALTPGAKVMILAGNHYRENIVPFLKDRGFDVTIPLEGLSIGRQLQYLSRAQ